MGNCWTSDQNNDELKQSKGKALKCNNYLYLKSNIKHLLNLSW